MGSDLKMLRLPAPTRGMTLAYAPDRLPAGYARNITNFLTHIPGKVVGRGAVTTPEITTVVGAQILASIWTNTYFETALFGYRESSSKSLHYGDMYTRRSEIAPAFGSPPYTNIQDSAAAGTSFYRTANLKTGAITVTSNLTEVAATPGHRFTQVGPWTMGPGYDTRQYTGTAFNPGSNYGFNYLARWAGTTAAPEVVAANQANLPRGIIDVAYHYNRLFVLGSAVNKDGTGEPIQTDPSGLDPYRFPVYSTLFYTNPAGGTPAGSWSTTAGPTASANWKNPLNGGQNFIGVGGSSDQDPGMGLAKVNGNLVILKRNSIWQLYGQSPDNFVLKQVFTDIGCVDTRSICATDNGVFFMSERGLMMFDGSSLANVSNDIWPEVSDLVYQYLVYPDGPGVSAATNLGFCTVGRLSDRYLLMSLGYDELTTQSGFVPASYLYNIESGAWSRFVSLARITNGGASGAFKWLVRGLQTVYVGNNDRLFNARRVTTPPSRFFQTAATADTQAGGGTAGIPLIWYTGLLNLSDPGSTTQLHRVITEYYYQIAQSEVANKANVGRMTAYDANATSLKTWTLPGAAAADTQFNKRLVQDTFHELGSTGSVFFAFEANTIPGTNDYSAAEIYGLDIEFQDGRQRRTG